MVDQTCLNIQPVHNHDVVLQFHIVIDELVGILLVEFEGVSVFVVDLVEHCRVTDTVVTYRHLCITVTLRVVGHPQGGVEVELLLLEVITEHGVKRQITVLIELILQIEVHLIRDTLAAAISHVQGIDDRRQMELGTFVLRLCCQRCHEVVTHDVPPEVFPLVHLMFGGVCGGCCFSLPLPFSLCLIDALVTLCQRYRTQRVNHFPAPLLVDAVGQRIGLMIHGVEDRRYPVAHKLER